MNSNSDMSKLAESLKTDKAKKELGSYLMEQLNDEQAKQLNSIMNDEAALNKLLSTEKAQRILKQLTGDKNG